MLAEFHGVGMKLLGASNKIPLALLRLLVVGGLSASSRLATGILLDALTLLMYLTGFD
jgi:hypothetical protein